MNYITFIILITVLSLAIANCYLKITQVFSISGHFLLFIIQYRQKEVEGLSHMYMCAHNVLY